MNKVLLISVVGISLLGCGSKKDDKKVSTAPTTVEILPSSPGTPPTKVETEVTLGELVCKDAGGYITGCQFENRTLATKQTSLTKFTLLYDFNCVGDRLPILIDFDGVEIFLKQEAGKTLILYGYGPFEIKDSDPDRTVEASLQVGCKLEFKEFKFEAL